MGGYLLAGAVVLFCCPGKKRHSTRNTNINCFGAVEGLKLGVPVPNGMHEEVKGMRKMTPTIVGYQNIYILHLMQFSNSSSGLLTKRSFISKLNLVRSNLVPA